MMVMMMTMMTQGDVEVMKKILTLSMMMMTMMAMMITIW